MRPGSPRKRWTSARLQISRRWWQLSPMPFAPPPRDRRHELLSAHPDLAGTAAVAGEVTEDSAREQAGAGLDTLSPEEFRRFTRLNGHYREKFGIPFIFAVRGATKHDILRGFGERMSGTPEEEFGIAIEQVVRIMRFRLEDRVRS